MEEKRVCDVCGREYPQSELMSFRDLILCGECLRTETTVCSCCGERIWADDNEGDGDTPLCSRCYEDYPERLPEMGPEGVNHRLNCLKLPYQVKKCRKNLWLQANAESPEES